MSRNRNSLDDIKNNNEAEKTSISHCRYCGRAEIQRENNENRIKKINNGIYLSIIIGNSIDLTMSSTERYSFKKDYEKFKLRVTLINLVLLAVAFIFPSRPIDAICHFLMVWYYCTLTIRESILIINGSKIHWWWVAHHYLACVVGGVALTWPDDLAYHTFRPQFILFTTYICFVQQLQYQYQSGCLRRLHSLGHGDSMDVTLEGFAIWMFQGLTFLLPFLMVVYLYEIYNAFTLYRIWATQDCVWQVPSLSALFGLVGTGNIGMVSTVVLRKMKESARVRVEQLKKKYPSMEKLQ